MALGPGWRGKSSTEKFWWVVISAVISCPPEHSLMILLTPQNSGEAVIQNPHFHLRVKKGGSERLSDVSEAV